MKFLMVFAFVFAACADVAPVDGTVRCNPTGKACPDNYQCAANGFCFRGSVDFDLGMTGADGGPNDLSSNTPADLTAPPPDLTPACGAIQVTTLSGTGAAGLVNGAGAVAQYDDPKGISIDSGGTLFIADNGNKVVRKVLADGTASTYAGGGSGAQAFLTSYRVAAGNFGQVYMVDEANDNVQSITSGGVASNLFNQGAVISLALDPNTGAIYNAITCGNITKWQGALPLVDFTGKNSSCAFMDGAAAVAQFSNPVDIQFDNGFLYVADNGNFRIRKVDSNGTASTLAGSTKGHTDAQGGSAQFDSPTGIAVDPQSHTVYVADNTTIRVVTQSGDVTTLAGSTSAFTNGNACVAKFGRLDGIAFFAGALYAVDINRIRKIQLP